MKTQYEITNIRTRIIGVLAVAMATLHLAAQGRNPSKSRLVSAAKLVTPTPFKPPNRLIWRLLEILAAHKGQASWWQPVVKTRDFEADWISMAPAQKTKTGFYADDRVFWAVEAGQMRVNIRAAGVCGEERIPGPGRASTRL